MESNDWDRTAPTTNIGEAQHHWTNINTGVSLSLLEAILMSVLSNSLSYNISIGFVVLSARECDEKVAAEIQSTLSTGILKNHRNDTFTRMSRSTARTAHAYKKVQQTRQKHEAADEVEQEILLLKTSQKETAAKLKDLKEKKSAIVSSKKGKSSKAESSSSGKYSSRKENAKEALKAANVKQGALIIIYNLGFHD